MRRPATAEVWMVTRVESAPDVARDEEELARFGYKQELRLQYAGATYLAIAATGMIYLAYFLGGLAILRARLAGWPRRRAPFTLGRWGVPVSLLGLAWGGSMLINFAWPRAVSNPNPTPAQTGKLLNFHWSWLKHRPVLW